MANHVIDLEHDLSENGTIDLTQRPSSATNEVINIDTEIINLEGVPIPKTTDEISISEVEFIATKRPPPSSSSSSSSTTISHGPMDHNPSLTKRPRQSKFSCPICLNDDIPSRHHRYALEKCHHQFCITCLANLISSSQRTTSSSTAAAPIIIRCPAIDCTHQLTMNDIRYLLRDNPTAWQSYTTAASLSLLEREIVDDRCQTRRCPAERCNYIFVHEGRRRRRQRQRQLQQHVQVFDDLIVSLPNDDDGHFFEEEGTPFLCPRCHARFCLDCGANNGRVGPQHEGRSCAERREELNRVEEERKKFDEWRRENGRADERFRKLVASEARRGLTKPCPRCGRLVTKNGGCDHMRCVCGHSYNWSAPR